MERDYDAEFAAIIAGYHTVSERDLPLEPDDPDSQPGSDVPQTPMQDLDPAAPGDLADPPAAPEPPSPWLERSEANSIAPIVNPSPIVRRPAAPEPTPHAEEGLDPGGDVPPPGIIEAGLDEGHFEPPPVHLPPQEDLHFWGIVTGLVLGPLMLLWVVFFASGESPWWGWIGAGLTLGGFALLIMRQPVDRDEDDDGARV